MAARKSYCIVDDTKQTVTFVAEKLTKKEQATVKGLIAIGYDPIRKSAEELYPAKNIYTKENVEKFLAAKGKEAKAQFDKIKDEPAVDKETGAVKTYANGKPRKKGYVAALKWFKDTYKDEFLASLEK